VAYVCSWIQKTTEKAFPSQIREVGNATHRIFSRKGVFSALPEGAWAGITSIVLFFSAFPLRAVIAAWPSDRDDISINPYPLDRPLPICLFVFSTEHCPTGVVSPATAQATMLLFLGFSALRTTPGVVGQTFRRKESSFPSSKNEGSATIGTLDRLVLKTHSMTSSLSNLS
jgi:hypothetical protein